MWCKWTWCGAKWAVLDTLPHEKWSSPHRLRLPLRGGGVDGVPRLTNQMRRKPTTGHSLHPPVSGGLFPGGGGLGLGGTCPKQWSISGSPYLLLPSQPYHHGKPNPNVCSELVRQC